MGASRMQAAVALQNAGEMEQAKQVYAQVLSDRPDHPHALHNLGCLHHAQGDSARAVGLIRQAISHADRPEPAGAFLGSLGVVYRHFQPRADLGRAVLAFEEGLAVFEQLPGTLGPDAAKGYAQIAYKCVAD